MSRDRFIEILNTKNEDLTEKDKTDLKSFLEELKRASKNKY